MNKSDLMGVGTMAEVLLMRAAQTPEALAFGFLIDGEEEGPRLTYADLDCKARTIAATLQDIVAPGDRALLVYAPGLAFISAFFGCQYAGIIPVPVYPPRSDRRGPAWQALLAIVADCRPSVILTDSIVGPSLSGEGIIPELASHCIVTDCLDSSGSHRWRAPDNDQDGIALLQYTSGSTAVPKGVMVTHQNLLHNEGMIQAAFEHAAPECGVCWLPPYHDMGLIGGLLQAVYLGASCMLLSPVAVLKDPSRWLRAISRYRAVTSVGPNFAYDFCVERITPKQKASLDLSNWRVAAIGSEPINPQTLDRFVEAFGECGFRREAFYPCYGLAEGTLFVTGGFKSAFPVIRVAEATTGQNRPLVGCGHPWAGQEVCLVHPESRVQLLDGQVGEIWVRGKSVARGYWNRPAETEETFHARLDSGAGPYLRTGDLGFLLDGELFVTGRLKEVIIIRGRNYYPEDIESTVQAVHPGLRTGCGAAFEVVRDGQPRLVVAQEVERSCKDLDPDRLTGDVRQAIVERHELQLYDLVLVEYGSIPKTTSGKIRRHAYRSGYESGTLSRWEGRKT